MPIPTSITDLSPVASSNSPSGSEPPVQGDDHIRALAAILRQLYDDVGSSASATKGAGQIGYSRSVDYADGTVGAKLNQTISVFDYFSDAQINDVVARTLLVDVSGAIQAAFDDAKTFGANLHFPSGTYLCTSGITYAMTGVTADDSMLHVNITGDGMSNTFIVTTATIGLSITGGTAGTEGVNTYLKISGLRIQKNTQTGTVLALNQIAYLGMEDCQIYGGSVGIDAKNVLVARWERVFLRGSLTGCTIQPDGAAQYNPNAITLADCLIAGNNTRGMVVTKAGNFTMIGGAVEVNGTQGNAATGGLKFVNAGAEGAVGVNLFGVYFEANAGHADIEITHGTEPCTYNVDRCNFNRTSSTAYCTYCVRLDQTSSFAQLNMAGSGFRSFGTYVANAGRPYVSINSSGGTWQVNDDTSYYQSSTETPVFTGPAQTIQSRAAAFCVFNGNTTGTNAPTRGYNVSTVQRVSTGRYIVSYEKSLSSNNIAVSVSSNAALIPRLISPANSSCEFILETSGGTATDTGYVSVTIFGV